MEIWNTVDELNLLTKLWILFLLTLLCATCMFYNQLLIDYFRANLKNKTMEYFRTNVALLVIQFICTLQINSIVKYKKCWKCDISVREALLLEHAGKVSRKKIWTSCIYRDVVVTGLNCCKYAKGFNSWLTSFIIV